MKVVEVEGGREKNKKGEAKKDRQRRGWARKVEGFECALC